MFSAQQTSRVFWMRNLLEISHAQDYIQDMEEQICHDGEI